jgi:hypothetical protein
MEATWDVLIQTLRQTTDSIPPSQIPDESLRDYCTWIYAQNLQRHEDKDQSSKDTEAEKPKPKL